jgi:hypothetical protein
VTKNDSVKALNTGLKGFGASISEFSYFFAGLDSHRRFIEIYPWSGINAKDLSQKYKSDVLVNYSSDKRTYFSLKLSTKRTGVSRSIRCTI